MTDSTERSYRITRDQWNRVNCVVIERLPGIPRQLHSLGILGDRQAGFGLGDTSGALDLAIAILVDHAVVSVEAAAKAFTNGFHTGDVRLLHIWMKHERLRDQRLLTKVSSHGEAIEVDEWELQRLLKHGFLTFADEQDFHREAAKREKLVEKEDE